MKVYAKQGYEWADDGLVGLWCPVLTGATGLNVLDGSNFANHGTATGYANEIQPWVGRSVGTTLNFDGSNDYIDVPNSSSLAGINELTISAWINLTAIPAATQGNRAWILTKLNTNNAEWELSVNAFNNSVVPYGRFAFASYPLTGTGSRVRGSLTAPQVGVLYHVVVTQAGRASTPNIYVQGVFENGPTSASGTPIAGIGTAPVQIGRRANGSDVLFNGQIPEAAIYNRVLTNSEIQSMNQARPGGLWQLQPRRPRSYFAQVLSLVNRRRSSRFLGFPG